MLSDTLELSERQTEAWDRLNDNVTREVFFGGGAGSGKSLLGCLFMVDRAMRYPGIRSAIARHQYMALEQSTMNTYWRLLGVLGYRPGEHYNFNGSTRVNTWANGSQHVFLHLQHPPSDPDLTRLGSTEFTDAFIDEGPDTDERTAMILASRLRYRTSEFGIMPKLLVTGNPGDSWVKTRYVYDKKNNRVKLPEYRACILATLKDNPDEEHRESYRATLEATLDEYDKARLLDGDWLIGPRTGMEFFPDFSSQKHASKVVPYDPSKALHITFDFNASPYMTLLVSQIHQKDFGRWHLAFIKEYTPSHPLSNTQAVCKMLAQDLKTGCFKGHNAGIFYYGDRNGRNNTSAATEEARHEYEKVENILRPWLNNGSDRALRSNPPHVKARDFMGHCFSGRLPIEITFNPDMHTTIADLVHLKQGADGGILKEKAVDPVTKVAYEKWGHCAQAVYYEVIEAFRSMYDQADELAG